MSAAGLAPVHNNEIPPRHLRQQFRQAFDSTHRIAVGYGGL